MMRETDADLAKEAEILDHLSSKWKCEWCKLGNGGKYRIDAVLHRGPKIVAWVEVKAHGTSFVGLNIPKYQEGMTLARDTEAPFVFAFSRDSKIGWIKVHGGGAWSDVTPNLRMAGGTPKGRKPLPDDIEPMMMFNETDISWMD
jgi:hypothetical protein